MLQLQQIPQRFSVTRKPGSARTPAAAYALCLSAAVAAHSSKIYTYIDRLVLSNPVVHRPFPISNETSPTQRQNPSNEVLQLPANSARNTADNKAKQSTILRKEKSQREITRNSFFFTDPASSHGFHSTSPPHFPYQISSPSLFVHRHFPPQSNPTDQTLHFHSPHHTHE